MIVKVPQTIRISTLAVFLFFLLFTIGNSQPVAQFTVMPDASGTYTPLWINLDDVTMLDESELQLAEISEKTNIPIAFQVEQGSPRKLWLLLGRMPPAVSTRNLKRFLKVCN